MLALEATNASVTEDKKLFTTLIELLSYEKIIFNGNILFYFCHIHLYTFHINTFVYLDLQMKPYRTDEYVHKLFYETSRFSAFNHQWVVKSRINNSQRDPHTSNERQITYQVKPNCFRFFFSNKLIHLFFAANLENEDQLATINPLLCIKRTILWHESQNSNIQTRFYWSGIKIKELMNIKYRCNSQQINNFEII